MTKWLHVPQRRLNNNGNFVTTGKIKIINTDNVTYIIEHDNVMEFHLVNGKSLIVHKEDYERNKN